MTINIAKDYTETPGGRNKSDGDFSGEDFREKFLLSQIDSLIDSNEEIDIDLDGGYGYGSSFLEEVFGGFVRELFLRKIPLNKIKDIVRRIIIKSDDEPTLIPQIIDYMNDEIEVGEKK